MKTAFEKIIERLEEPTNYTIMCGKHFTTVDRAIEIVNQVAEEYSNSEIPNKSDGWIPCSSGKMPENEERVWVVLSHTYEDEYIEYSVARYLRFDNNECHWCEVKYGYLEWDKYSNGTAGSSFYKVIAWKQITPYQPKGE